jgi:hypothetical protein
MAAVVLTLGAAAADLAARPYTKAPLAPIPVGYHWSGFYLGVMGGYGCSDRVNVRGITTQLDRLVRHFRSRLRIRFVHSAVSPVASV